MTHLNNLLLLWSDFIKCYLTLPWTDSRNTGHIKPALSQARKEKKKYIRREAASWIFRVSSPSHLSCSTFTTPFTTPPATLPETRWGTRTRRRSWWDRRIGNENSTCEKKEKKLGRKKAASWSFPVSSPSHLFCSSSLPWPSQITGNFHKFWQELSSITKKETKSQETILVKQRQYQWNSSSYKQAQHSYISVNLCWIPPSLLSPPQLLKQQYSKPIHPHRKPNTASPWRYRSSRTLPRTETATQNIGDWKKQPVWPFPSTLHLTCFAQHPLTWPFHQSTTTGHQSGTRMSKTVYEIEAGNPAEPATIPRDQWSNPPPPHGPSLTHPPLHLVHQHMTIGLHGKEGDNQKHREVNYRALLYCLSFSHTFPLPPCSTTPLSLLHLTYTSPPA